MGDEIEVLPAGETLPFTEQRLPRQRDEIREPDKVPLGFRADVNEARGRILGKALPGFGRANIACI